MTDPSPMWHTTCRSGAASLVPGAGPHAPPQAEAGGADPELLVVTEARGEELVGAAQVLGDEDGVCVQLLLQGPAQLVGVEGGAAHVGRVEVDGPGHVLRPRGDDARDPIPGRHRSYGVDDGPGRELDVGPHGHVHRPVASHGLGVEPDPDRAGPGVVQGDGGRTSDVGDSDAQDQVPARSGVVAGKEGVPPWEVVVRPFGVAHRDGEGVSPVPGPPPGPRPWTPRRPRG